MTWKRHHDRVAFAKLVTPMLARYEALNNLQLGIMSRLAANRPASMKGEDAPPLLLALENDGEIAAVAVRTPPHSIILTEMSDDAVRSLVELLRAAGENVPGVVGPTETSRRFSELFRPGGAVSPQLHHRVRAYQLAHEPLPPPPASGSMRTAEPADIPLLAEWIEAFARFINEPHPDPKGAAERLAGDGRMFLWQDGDRVVSMTALGADTPNGVRVNSVYTPEEFRGRGYAANLVAAVSRAALSRGRKFCFLFADTENATSTGIYVRMGYKPVCDYEHYVFPQAP